MSNAIIPPFYKFKILPFILIVGFIILVPALKCSLFFDSYLVKLWLVQFGVVILSIYYLYQILFKDSGLFICNIHWLLLVYALINVTSWILIPLPHRFPALPVLFSLFGYVLLCFFVSQYLKEEKKQNIIVSLWLLTTLGICIYSVYQYLHKMRVIGTLGNENFLAAYLGITIPISIGFFLKYLNKNKLFFFSGMAVSAVFFITLYLTHARGAWLGLFWSSVSFLVIGWCPKGKRLIITALIVVLVIGSFAMPLSVRFILLQLQGDVRPPIWESTLNMFTERPWLGWGKGAYFIFYPQFRVQDYWLVKSPTDLTIHAHNEFLQILAETGLAGLIFFLILIIMILRSTIKNIDRAQKPYRYLLLGVTSGVIGLLAHNLVCNNLQTPGSAIMFWFMIGLLISNLPAKKINLGAIKILRCWIFLALTLFIVIINWQVVVRPLVSQYYFKEGWKYRDKENWDSAINRYEKAIKWYPWDIEMYYRLAYAYTMDKQYDKAIEEYNNVIRLAPLYGSVHRNMGIVYMKIDKYRQAVKSFLEALKVNEYDLISRINLGKMRKKYGNK